MTEDPDQPDAASAPPAKPKRPTSAYDAPTAEKVAFGKRMVEARELAGLNQAEAAAALGYSQQVQLHLMESGQRMPTLRVLLGCAAMYGTTLDFLGGLADDSDRDPAVVAQREVAQRVTADVRRLIATITASATDAVRQLRPDAGRTARMASQVVELAAVLDRLREHDGETFDGLRAGALLVRRTAAALDTAREHLAAVARAQRQAATVPVDLAGIAGLDEVGDPTGLVELAGRLARQLPVAASGNDEADEADAEEATP